MTSNITTYYHKHPSTHAAMTYKVRVTYNALVVATGFMISIYLTRGDVFLYSQGWTKIPGSEEAGRIFFLFVFFPFSSSSLDPVYDKSNYMSCHTRAVWCIMRYIREENKYFSMPEMRYVYPV